MAALARLHRVLQSGMIAGALMLAATPSGALAAGSPGSAVTAVLGPPANALNEDVTAEKGSIAARAPYIDGELFPGLAPANVKTVIQRTLSAADLQSLLREAGHGAALETDARVRDLGAELDLREETLARMFEMFGRQDVPPERLVDVLAETVARHKSLLETVRLLEASDPRAAELRDAAAAAIETAEYDRVDALLAEAEAIGFEAMRQLLKELDQRVLAAAAIYPEAGDLAGSQVEHNAAQLGALLHGAGRFCDWHSGHRLCQLWADSSPFCDRLPNHPLCDDDDDDDDSFCRRHPDHKRCEQPPSPS